MTDAQRIKQLGKIALNYVHLWEQTAIATAREFEDKDEKIAEIKDFAQTMCGNILWLMGK